MGHSAWFFILALCYLVCNNPIDIRIRRAYSNCMAFLPQDNQVLNSLTIRLSLNLLRNLFFLILVMLSGLAPAAENKSEQFQSILDDAVGTGLMAVSAHISWGNESWTGVAGESSADSGEQLNSDSLFRIASITKLFTATLVLQLVDENALQLSDILADRLPLDVVADIPHADSITIEMLLDHSSGIRSFSDIDSFWKEAYRNGGLERIWEPEELISYALQDKPYFIPGIEGRTQYSNSNYILLGMIVEEVTGESLSVVYRRRIYEPLGMNHTLLEGFNAGLSDIQHSFMKTGFRNRIVAISRGWNPPSNEGLYDVSGNYQLYNSWTWAAGGIASTSGDLDRFLKGVRDGSLLSGESQDVLFRINSAEGDTVVVFGGSGGWEGITSSAYEINDEIRIILLANTTGFDIDADSLRGQLYRVLRP